MDKRVPGELIIQDGKKRIILSMEGKKHLGWRTDENGKTVGEIDNNQIEIAYRADDEDGWGAGGGEYFSTADIKAMADGIRSVVLLKRGRVEHFCQDDLFRMCIEYDSSNDCFSFTVALLETLMREYHITITKTGLTQAALDVYIKPFFEWEKEFPII